MKVIGNQGGKHIQPQSATGWYLLWGTRRGRGYLFKQPDPAGTGELPAVGEGLFAAGAAPVKALPIFKE